MRSGAKVVHFRRNRDAHVAVCNGRLTSIALKNLVFRVDHNLEACWQPRRNFPWGFGGPTGFAACDPPIRPAAGLSVEMTRRGRKRDPRGGSISGFFNEIRRLPLSGMRKQRPFRDGFDDRAKSIPSGPSFPDAEGRKRAHERACADMLSERVKSNSPRVGPTRPD
jgi:hypothetical protein